MERSETRSASQSEISDNHRAIKENNVHSIKSKVKINYYQYNKK